MKEMELELTDGVTVEEIVDYINKNNMYRFERKQKDGEFWAVRSLIQKDIAMNQALSKYEALGDRFKLRDSENIQDLDMGIVPTEEEEKLWNQVKKSLDEVLKCIDISQEMGQVTQDIATTVLQFGIEESQVDSKMKDLKRKEKKKEIMNNAKEAIFRRRSIVVLGATGNFFKFQIYFAIFNCSFLNSVRKKLFIECNLQIIHGSSVLVALFKQARVKRRTKGECIKRSRTLDRSSIGTPTRVI